VTLAAAEAPALDAARALLRDVYGYAAFRGLQEEVIAAALAGRDALVLMPTGGGKSICYQVPARLRHGTGVVVSPLIALMQDQVRALRQVGLRAACLNSALPRAAQQAVLDDFGRGDLDLLYVAPERLLQPGTLAVLARHPVSLIAIDEAHCVSQWGHDFRQDYLGLHALAGHFPGVPRMALTATADPRTREEIVDRLALRDPARFVAGFDRPNIRYRVEPRRDARRDAERFLAAHAGEAGIVYCATRARVERTSEWLRQAGVDALPYHAGMDAATRARHQERFLAGDGVVVVATIAFGMGIDKPDVRFVLHLDLPKSLEGYYQETGRAGRDGAAAEALLLYGLDDVVRQRQMIDDGAADADFKRVARGKLEQLLAWCEITTCRRRALLAHFGETVTADCGNCDVCLWPPGTFDGTVAAQKLLSCVYRVGQRFGAGHVLDVLRGQETAKVRQFGHQRLSTFGVGGDVDVDRWRSVLRQLLVQGYLRVDAERYGALVLTDSSRALLRGEVALTLRADVAVPRPAKGRRTVPAPAVTATSATHADAGLLAALRACRTRLAAEAQVPPYVVFHDRTLAEMAARRPATRSDLLVVHGVGSSKLERFGDAFLDVIRAHATPDDG
jgi:ATP-dependent DNA helicase RecQ